MKTGEKARFQYFEEFVATPPLEGLGASIDLLMRLCKDDKEALDAIDRAVQRPDGRPAVTLDNIQGFPSGTSEQAAIRRLRKDRPDLLEEVKVGPPSRPTPR